MAAPIPVVLDTDIGTDVDDAIALALLLASPELDLRAVTTVSGDVELRARIAKQLLLLAQRPEVPVAAGIRDPILRQRAFLSFGHEGRGIVTAASALPIAPVHGVDLLIDTVRRARPHLIAIGPLANLAVAIMKEPAIIAAIPHLTLMGGALGLHPDVPPVEYNLASDPEATLVVLTAGIPVTMVPLDVTWQVALTTDDLARLRRSRSRVVQVLCDAIEIWAPLQRSFFSSFAGWNPSTVALLHDPLTVAAVIDPGLVTIESRRLQAVIADGMLRLTAAADAPVVDVAVAVDAPRFVDFLLDRLLSLP